MPLTLLIDDNFTRADTTVGTAQSTTGVGNGWVDRLGGQYSINSNRLKGLIYNPDFYGAPLYQPTASGTQQVILNTIAQASGDTTQWYIAFRIDSTSENTYYALVLSPANQIQLFKFDRGASPKYVQIDQQTATVDLTANAYKLDATITGTSPSVITWALTGPGTTAVGSGTFTEGTFAAAQITGGYAGIGITNNTSPEFVSRARVYTDSGGGGITPPPAATSYLMLDIPTAPVVGQTYSVSAVTNAPVATTDMVVTGTAGTGLTWSSPVTIPIGSTIGAMTITCTTPGVHSIATTHTGGGFTGDPAAATPTAVAAAFPTVSDIVTAIVAAFADLTVKTYVDATHITLSDSDPNRAQNLAQCRIYITSGPGYPRTNSIVSSDTTTHIQTLAIPMTVAATTATTYQIVTAGTAITLAGGTVLGSPTPTATTFSASGAALTAPTGGHVGMKVLFLSGLAAGQSRVIATHTVSGSTHAFTLLPAPASPLAGLMTGGETFVIG